MKGSVLPKILTIAIKQRAQIQALLVLKMRYRNIQMDILVDAVEVMRGIWTARSHFTMFARCRGLNSTMCWPIPC